MSEPSPFKVVQVCSVAPQHGSTTPTTTPLTFFDLFWLRFPPVERLFFYEFPEPSTSFYDSVLPNLKQSLSLTLQHFLPLVGTITWPSESPKPIIQCVPGDSVSFTIAESDGNSNFNHLCSNLVEASERYPLVPQLAISHEKASLLALQVTVFPNFGFCIGIAAHHAAMDGKSSTLFMKAWAYACSKLGESPSSSSSLPENLTPCFDGTVIRDPTRIAEAYADSWLENGGPNNRSVKVWELSSNDELAKGDDGVKGFFELTPTHIQKLKQYAQAKMMKRDNNNTSNVQLSAFSVTCAYVLACLVKAEQPKDNEVIFAYSVDCRSRLDPPIMPSYFGNCIMAQWVEVEKESLLENDGFISVLERIIESLKRVEDVEVLKGAETKVSDMITILSKGRAFSTAGSPRFEVYSIDFGWGKPKRVDMTSTDKTGAFCLSDSRNKDGGIEIGLALSKGQMEDVEVLKGAETKVSDMITILSKGRAFSTAGSPRFEVYSIDFGWGKPKRVDMTSTDKTGAFCLSDSRNKDGGIEIGLALSKGQMEVFSALFVQGLESC